MSNWRNTLLWANIPEPNTEFRTNADFALAIAREAFSALMNTLPQLADDVIPWKDLPIEVINATDPEAITEIIRMKIKQWADGIESGDIFASN